MICVCYRPRQPRASPVWQILCDHVADVLSLAPEVAVPVCRTEHGTGRAIGGFLDCGDLHAGFARHHCPDCDYEDLLAFFCEVFAQRKNLPDGLRTALGAAGRDGFPARGKPGPRAVVQMQGWGSSGLNIAR